MGKVFKSNIWLLILDPEAAMCTLGRVKYEESSIGFEKLACLQSIKNKCNDKIKNRI